jgi:hypothetical protein
MASRRTNLTVLTALGLVGLWSIYSIAVVPAIASRTISRGHALIEPGTRTIRPIKSSQMAVEHLEHKPWTHQAKYQMHAGDSYVYFEEWEHKDSKKAVKFEPFAIIRMPKSQDDDQPPIIIVSDSAYVEFAKPFSITDPDPGRVVKGSLNGNVRITGAHGLSIASRMFTFEESKSAAKSEMHVWCDYEIQFAYGPHNGTAHSLEVYLNCDKQARKKDRLEITGIKTIQLRKDVNMNLVSESEDEQQPPVDVNIRSAGSFNFVVATHIATFEEEVKVRSHKRPRPDETDSLDCDLLKLNFEAVAPGESSAGDGPSNQRDVAAGDHTAVVQAGESLPAERKVGPLADLSSELTFRRLTAEGKRVTLKSNANRLSARMTRLTYDAKTMVAVLSDPESVWVSQTNGEPGAVETSELSSPEVTMIHDDEDNVTHTSCQGGGWLKSYQSGSGNIQFAAQWSKQLQMYPDAETGLEIIELQQQALVRRPEQEMGLAAEFIRLWIDRQQPARPVAHSEEAASPSNRFSPRRLLALDNVAVITPRMQGETDRLEVWFEEAPLETTRKSAAPAQRTRRGSGRRGIRQASRDASDVSRKSAGVSQAAGDENEGRSPTDGPIHLVAKRLRALMLHRSESDETTVAEVQADGTVRVTQERQKGRQPLRIDGDRLHVQNRSETDQLLQVNGTPAHIRDQEMHIEGGNIHLDRGRNVAWVDGKGLLELPVKQTLDGEQLAQQQILSVTWVDEMTFNGRSAQFFGEVASDLADNRMTCDEMEVVLSQHISFTDDNVESDEREIEHVICKGGVDFESKEYKGTKLIEIRTGHFPHFSLNQQTGDAKATGPGHIETWQRGRGRRASLSPLASVQANRPLEPDVADWEYTKVRFAGAMEGNTKRQETVFRERVEIVYGPVKRPHLKIDPELLPKDGGWMSGDSLTVTQRQDPASQTDAVELVARGNAKLEGRSFQARADTVSYDEAKGMYILHSRGDRAATIWREMANGDRRPEEARHMLFIPAKNLLQLSRLTRLQL